LKAIKENDGVLLAHGEENYMLWDLVDIDRFHFGRVEDTLFSQYTGWAKGAYFWQLVPAGLRPVMKYPVPTQQAPAFGKQVQALMARGRNKKQMETIVRLADASGADLSEVVFRASHPGKTQVAGLQLVAGKHPDGVAWTGCAYRCDLGNKHEILVVKARGGKEKMGSMAARASRGRGGKKVVAAVNGGYILNNELVGKIGLREELVGTPLGLVMQGGEIHSLPLFYRPALVTDDRGGVRIDRVGLPGGRLRGVGSKRWLVWTAEMINPEETEGPLVVYTPHYEGKVRFSGRVLVTVCAQKVAAVARPRFLLQKDVYARLLPVGVTYSFDEKVFDSEWQETLVVGRGLEFDLKFGKTFEGAVDALEAGPLLVWEGKEAINVAVEGWSGGYSRQIQAARLDRLDLRGPKIGVGITRKEELIVLVINGRLRDSYGATFGELAKELVALGAWKAMAIDPGGSATLWVEGRVRNIHPYNDDFMEHPYAASPEARGVANGLVVVEK
jgi:hypothetical protein